MWFRPESLSHLFLELEVQQLDLTELIQKDRAAWDALYGHAGDQPIWHSLPFLDELVVTFRQNECFKIMDAACGDAGQLRALPEDMLVVGVDQSAKAVADAERHLRAAGRRNYLVLQSLMEATPFPPGSFDGVLFVDMLCCLIDPLPTLREFQRLVRPGGLLITTTLAPSDTFGTKTIVDAGGVQLFNGVFISRVEPAETLAQWYRDAGFEVLSTSQRMDFEEAHPGFREDRHSHARIVMTARRL